MCIPLLVTAIRVTRQKVAELGLDTVLKALVAVMKALRPRVVLQLRSGSFL